MTRLAAPAWAAVGGRPDAWQHMALLALWRRVPTGGGPREVDSQMPSGSSGLVGLFPHSFPTHRTEATSEMKLEGRLFVWRTWCRHSKDAEQWPPRVERLAEARGWRRAHLVDVEIDVEMDEMSIHVEIRTTGDLVRPTEGCPCTAYRRLAVLQMSAYRRTRSPRATLYSRGSAHEAGAARCRDAAGVGGGGVD